MGDIKNDESSVQGSNPLQTTMQDSSTVGNQNSSKKKEGDNSEFSRVAHDVHSSQDRISHDIARLQEDKKALASQVKSLGAQLRAAEGGDLPISTAKRLEALRAEAEDKLKTLSGVVPETAFSRDRATMETIIKKWREYDRERTHQAIAENKFNVNPEDKRAEGDINRARATAYALNQEITSLVEQGEEQIARTMPDPTQDESIVYTHEQAVADAGLRAQKQPTKIQNENEEVAPQVAAPTTTEQVQPVVTQDLDPVIWEDMHPELEPELHPKIEEEATAKLAPAKIEMPIAATETVVNPDSDKALIYSQKQTFTGEEFGAQKKSTTPVLNTVAPAEKSPGETPTQSANTVSEKVETESIIPQELMPNDPKVLSYANAQLEDHITLLFGRKGFWGLFAKKGTNSPHWKDPVVGFRNKIAREIVEAKPIANTKIKHFGIEDPLATKKMREYMDVAQRETGVRPEAQEKIEEYLKRAVAVTFKKLLEKKDTLQTKAEPAPAATVISSIPSEPPIVSAVPLVEKTMPPLPLTQKASIREETDSSEKAIQEAVEKTIDAQKESPYKEEKQIEEIVAPPEAETPQAELKEEVPPVMPQEFVPSDPQIIAYADTAVHNHLDILFGSKGFLGLGSKRGIDSPNWKDEVVGFARKTVPEILEAENIVHGNRTGHFGMQNSAAVEKMQNYLMIALNETQVHPQPEEKVEEYLKRAAAITIYRYLKEQKETIKRGEPKNEQ